MTAQPEPHSTTGFYFRGGKDIAYNHIRVELCRDTISSCNSCGRINYKQADDQSACESNGLRLVDLTISPNGYHGTVTRLCPECIRDLRTKLFAFSA